MLGDAREDLTAFTAFPVAHWRKLWSTNPLERLNKEIKRRTNVVGIFPDDAAVLRLAGAVLIEAHDEWQVAERRYLSEGSMAKLTPTKDDDRQPKEVKRAPAELVAT
jgi:transposase-like protein